MPRLQFEYDPAYIKLYSQKRGYCKGAFQEEVKSEVKKEVTKEQPGLPKPKPAQPTTNLTNGIVNLYIPEHPEIVSTYLRDERPMEAQRKQMHVRSVLNKTF